MQLKSIPGAPSYYVDCDKYDVYKFNVRGLTKLSTRMSWRSLVLHIEGRSVGTTAYRCAYAAIHGIDVTKIPGDYCISHDGQKIIVRTRAMLTAANRKMASKEAEIERNYKQLSENWAMIHKYFHGKPRALTIYLEELQEQVRRYYLTHYGMSEERADIISGGAINMFQEMLDRGDIDCHIRRRVFSFAKHVRFQTVARPFNDNFVYPDEITIN